jgi:hypothetical protein
MSHNLQITRITKSTIIHNKKTPITNRTMKGVPHISICQQLLSEKLLGNIYLKIGCLLRTISDLEFEMQTHCLFQYWTNNSSWWKGSTIVDSIMLVVITSTQLTSNNKSAWTNKQNMHRSETTSNTFKSHTSIQEDQYFAMTNFNIRDLPNRTLQKKCVIWKQQIFCFEFQTSNRKNMWHVTKRWASDKQNLYWIRSKVDVNIQRSQR